MGSHDGHHYTRLLKQTQKTARCVVSDVDLMAAIIEQHGLSYNSSRIMHDSAMKCARILVQNGFGMVRTPINIEQDRKIEELTKAVARIEGYMVLPRGV